MKKLNFFLKNGNLRGRVLSDSCPSRRILRHLTSRWGILVLVTLYTGTKRFGELRREIEGISERMLTQTLQNLEQDGMVYRHDFDREVVPKIRTGVVATQPDKENTHVQPKEPRSRFQGQSGPGSPLRRENHC